MLRNRLFFEWLAVTLAGFAFIWWASATRLTERIDYQLLDVATLVAAGDASGEIVLVRIDDSSLQERGSWPWPRREQARLIEAIAATGPGLIVYDVLLTEPTAEEDDAALARALTQAGQVMLPHSYVTAQDRLQGLDPSLPLERFQAGAAGIGHVALDFANDGAVRQIELVKEAGGRSFPHLAMEATRVARGSYPSLAAQRPIVPIRQTGSYVEVSAGDVMSGRVPRELLHGKTVFVGATALGLGDTYPVSNLAGGAMSGIEIQANLYDDIGRGLLIQPVPRPVALGTSIMLFAVFMLGLRYLKPGQSLSFAIALGLAVPAVALALPPLAQVWFAPGTVLAAITISYPLWSWRRLANVIGFLSRESTRLRSLKVRGVLETGGFDELDRQANQLGHLVSMVRDRFEFVRAVIRELPDPVVVLDSEGRSVLFNDKALTLFEEPEPGLTLPDLLAGGKAATANDGKELLLDSGRIFTIERAFVTVEQGAPQAEIVQFHEITAIRTAQRERQEMLEFLSHDMRTPQVAIMALSRQGGAGSDTYAEDNLARIRAQAQRTLKLADDFVQIARMEERPPAMADCDLSGLAEEAADRIWPVAKENGVTVERQMADEPLFIRGNVALLSRMIDNLLGNAVKFSPEGSAITISTRAAEAGRATAILEVSDRGPGLPDDRRHDPFRRFGSSVAGRGAPGAGLGLAFVEQVLRRHEADIDVASEPGAGTRFTIRFDAV